MAEEAEKLELGIEVGGDFAIPITAWPVTFRTGSTGYRFSDKLILKGVRYQLNGQLVRIGSRPKDPPE